MDKEQQGELFRRQKHCQSSGGGAIQAWAAFSVCYICIAAGNFLGYTSAAVPSMQQDWRSFPALTHHDISWIGGLSPLGAMCGSVLTTIPIGHFGTRQTVLLFAAPVLLISWLTITFSSSIGMILFGRLLGGMGSGIAITCGPIYVVEIASDEHRGRLGICPQFLMIFGIWVSNVLGSFLSWRELALASAILTFPAFVLLPFAPDSPAYYISRNDLNEAVKTFRKLRGYKQSVDRERDSLESQTSEFLGKTEFQPLADKANGNDNEAVLKVNESNSKKFDVPTMKACAVALGLMSFQQLTGINGVTFYAVTIFKETPGVSAFGPYAPAIALVSMQCFAICISTCFVERLGRKFLLVLSATILSVSSGAISGYFFYCRDGQSTPPAECEQLYWAPLALLICFVFGFAIGFGPLSWIVVSEILPEQVRNMINPLAIGYSWFCIFLVTKSFPLLMIEINLSGIFALFASVGVLSVAFLLICLPETKGKSLTEIQRFFGKL